MVICTTSPFLGFSCLLDLVSWREAFLVVSYSREVPGWRWVLHILIFIIYLQFVSNIPYPPVVVHS